MAGKKGGNECNDKDEEANSTRGRTKDTDRQKTDHKKEVTIDRMIARILAAVARLSKDD